MLNLVSERDSHTCQVGTYSAYDLTIEGLRRLNAGTDEEYRPAKVKSKTGQILWHFDKTRFPGAHATFFGLEDEDDDCIVYLNHRFVYEVVPLKDLPQWRSVRDASGRETHEGGRPVAALVELKLFIADAMNLEPFLSKVEGIVARAIRQRWAQAAAEARAKRVVETQEVDDQRMRERQARIAAIMTRPPITVYTAEGRRLTGIPVVGDEYRMVLRDRWVVSVESYDNEARQAGQPTEHFQVVKSDGGRINRAHVRAVTLNDSRKPVTVATRQGEAVIQIGSGDPDVIPLYGRQDISALHADGLNGGTRVGLYPVNPDGTIVVYEVTKKGARELGRFQNLAA